MGNGGKGRHCRLQSTLVRSVGACQMRQSTANLDRRGRRVQISVVVPTFNRREVVLRTLETLSAQDFARDQYEIVVVVDGSTDGTAAAVRSVEVSCALSVVEQP